MLINTAPTYGGPFLDILYGVPISASKLSTLNNLRSKLGKGIIHIIIDHPSQVSFVEEFTKKENTKRFSVFLKLDTGYHRAGITCDDRGVDLAMLILNSPHLTLKGVYSHW